VPSTTLFDLLRECSASDSNAKELLHVVETVYRESVGVAKTVVRYMPEYTLHDEQHINNVLDLMARLIPEDVRARLQPLEIACLILSAALHDIGMAPTAEEVTALRAHTPPPGYEETWRNYRALKESHSDLVNKQNELRAQGKHGQAEDLEGYFLSEFIRTTHAERSKDFLFKRYGDRLQYGYFDFAARLSDVCLSHNEPVEKLAALPCWELVRAPGEYCNWRFLAVMLRLADILDFDPKRTPRLLFDQLGVRSPISISEWRKHSAISGWDIRPGRIAFGAQCPDPVIEKCIRDFINMIDAEIDGARVTLLQMHDPAAPERLVDRYNICLPPNVDVRNVGPKSGPDGPLYDYVDLAFTLDQSRIISLLMGVRLYSEKELFIRELLQNAVDACRHRAAIHQQRPELGLYHPEVCVRLDERDGREFLEIEDNGMGMNDYIVRNYFARIGRSYYTSPDFEQNRSLLGLRFKPVSQFGIGVLSSFMVGDLLHVESKRFDQGSRPLSVEICGEGALFWFRKGIREVPGTKIGVRLSTRFSDLMIRYTKRSQDKKISTHDLLCRVVSSLAPHVEFPIRVQVGRATKIVRERWEVDHEYHHRYADFIKTIELDLTQMNIPGIKGTARVFVLSDAGRLTDEVILPEVDDDDNDEEPITGGTPASRLLISRHDTRSRLVLMSGTIRREYVEYSARGRRQTSYSPTITSKGRWSQQGFEVPHPLVNYPEWSSRKREGPSMIFPFPLYYDLDLSGDFVLPLTVDRRGVITTEETEKVMDRIAAVLYTLLLGALGADDVKKNKDLLQRVNKRPMLQEILAGYLADEPIAQYPSK
jgi:molecular chaperone HtpG